MTPEEFAVHFREHRASAILRAYDTDVARRAMEAAVRGGFRVVEFTLSVPDVFDLVAEFSKRPELTVGTGTVLTVEQAKRSVEAGAKFIVSPVTDEAVIAAAAELGVASVPGTHTPTEMLRAHRAGATMVKLFPAPGDGPAYVKQTLGPLPFLKIVPTAGVDESNVARFFEAGAWAVGFVTSLFDPAELKAGNVDAIESRAKRLLKAAGIRRE